MISYVDDFVYWYKYEALGKLFLDTLGKRFHVNFLVYSHCFMSISISHMKYHYISVDRARYYTSILAKYMYTSTFNKSTKFEITTLPYDMIFTKYDTSTSYDKVEKFTK